jgi:hypothetical protein
MFEMANVAPHRQKQLSDPNVAKLFHFCLVHTTSFARLDLPDKSLDINEPHDRLLRCLSGTLIALSINGGSPSRHERDLILKSFKEGHAFF